jgi:hypothetical protein
VGTAIKDNQTVHRFKDKTLRTRPSDKILPYDFLQKIVAFHFSWS